MDEELESGPGPGMPPYAPPLLISSEPLELTGAGCLTPPKGKSIPSCAEPLGS